MIPWNGVNLSSQLLDCTQLNILNILLLVLLYIFEVITFCVCELVELKTATM